MSRRAQLVVTILFVLGMFAPALAWLGGTRADDTVFNPAMPRPAVEDWGVRGFFDAKNYALLGAYLTDRMPLRSVFQENEARIDWRIFHDSPVASITPGKGDWLFWTDNILGACAPNWQAAAANLAVSLPQAVSDWLAMVERITAAAGVELIVTAPPSKAAVHPERLIRRSHAAANCAAKQRAELAKTLVQHDSMLALWDPMRTAAESITDGESLYYHQDLHWNSLGASVFARQLVDRVQPGLWDPDALTRKGEEEIYANAAHNIHLPRIETAPHYQIARPGIEITTVRQDQPEGAGQTNPRVWEECEQGAPAFELNEDGALVQQVPHLCLDTSPVRILGAESEDPDALIAGRTLMLHDSMGWMTIPMLSQYFQDITFANLYTTLQTDWFIEELGAVDRLILETQELNFWALPSLDPRFPFLDNLLLGLRDRLPTTNIPLTKENLRSTKDVEFRNGAVVTTTVDGQLLLPSLPPKDDPDAFRYLAVELEIEDQKPDPLDIEDYGIQLFWGDDPKSFDETNQVEVRKAPGHQLATFPIDALGDTDGLFFRVDPGGLVGTKVLSIDVIDIPPMDASGAASDADVAETPEASPDRKAGANASGGETTTTVSQGQGIEPRDRSSTTVAGRGSAGSTTTTAVADTTSTTKTAGTNRSRSDGAAKDDRRSTAGRGPQAPGDVKADGQRQVSWQNRPADQDTRAGRTSPAEPTAPAGKESPASRRSSDQRPADVATGSGLGHLGPSGQPTWTALWAREQPLTWFELARASDRSGVDGASDG
jgi:hypothetical protein